PPAHVDWDTDLVARRAYLDALWTFVDTLAPSFNWLRAVVLYHQLDLDRRLDVHDRERLLRYLALPRQASWADPAYVRGFPASELVPPGEVGAPSAGLAPISGDEALVRHHLAYFLAREELDAFAAHLERSFLGVELATARLLAGDSDVARWTRMLPEAA